jgi:serine protease AprX
MLSAVSALLRLESKHAHQFNAKHILTKEVWAALWKTGTTMTISPQCPLCGEHVSALIHFHADSEMANRLRAEHPEWFAEQGACTRCVDYGNLLLLKEKNVNSIQTTADSYLVLPTPLRLDANTVFKGKGVTICFIDSGFSLHPDLIQPKNRILCAVDMTGSAQPNWFAIPHDDNWHGTMTSVVCAGNGQLYCGIASEAKLVLLKVKNEQGISRDNIARAIRWAIEHKDKYNIRIINLSVTDDFPTSYKDSEVDQAAEDAIAAGIVVVAAVGNDASASVKPPANSPNVIAVGGVNDHNTLGMFVESAYHSTFGVTVDNFLKPELIAPSIWLAAPILPKSKQHREATALFTILGANERHIKNILVKELENTSLDSSLLFEKSADAIRQHVVQKIADMKYISPDFQHADGTSFAAPIVSSVIAQMLEANPMLTPKTVRQILLTTARRLAHVPIERQGFGVINAKETVTRAIAEMHTFDFPDSPVVDLYNQRIIFYYHNDQAKSVALAGSFNDWKPNAMLFTKNGRGIWKAEISMLPKGKHLYKFVLDNKEWITDAENSHREADGFGGLNSKVVIE